MRIPFDLSGSSNQPSLVNYLEGSGRIPELVLAKIYFARFSQEFAIVLLNSQLYRFLSIMMQHCHTPSI
jgi:hypothetical protein